ncbi:kinase-like domain-containing protein [Mycena alexandri]|uniref:Kinase-like domain-containing protein n=1 Tax=Mycena alexandri TaxID=1745969 RepID=A0AAD6SWH4_9AGAR|nr:kinase-like domain-containing protein [Mycena alexandri]
MDVIDHTSLLLQVVAEREQLHARHGSQSSDNSACVESPVSKQVASWVISTLGDLLIFLHSLDERLAAIAAGFKLQVPCRTLHFTFRLTEVHERSPLGTSLLSTSPSPTLVHSPSPVKASEALENIVTSLESASRDVFLPNDSLRLGAESTPTFVPPTSRRQSPSSPRGEVAIKVIRVPDHGSGPPRAWELSKRLRREADIWIKLHHPNVLPFLGICDDERVAPHPVLISPFCKFGHVGNYVTKHPSADRDELIYGVTCGLAFLHANDIVHGRLKVQNVVVDKRGGLELGTVPYMAPELLAAESVSPTKESDVFSWALLALEACGQQTTAFVTSQIGDALRPRRSDYDAQKVTDDHWAILERCWTFEPHQRPSIGDVLSWLPPSSHTKGA